MNDVTLRRATPDDATAVNEWRADPEARRYQPMRQHDLATMRQILTKRGELPLDPTYEGKVQWIILVDGKPAGWVSLDVTSRQSRLGSVGYTVSGDYRGRGVASKALQEAVGLAFAPDVLALERLEANVAVANVASQRVLESAGFQREGLARGLLLIDGIRVDHFRYGLLLTDLAPG
ncbi:MAG: GNAT family N-acetyltransferase [Thermomicrobiales bacterium]